MTRDAWFLVLMCCAIPFATILLHTLMFLSVAWAPVLWNAFVKYPALEPGRYRVGVVRRHGEIEIKEPGIILIPPFTGRGVVIPLTEQEGDLLMEVRGKGAELLKGKYSYMVYDPQKYVMYDSETIKGLINATATVTINWLIRERSSPGNELESETIKEEMHKQLQRVSDRFGVRIKNVVISRP
jgi:hypothetical protein